MSSIEDLEKRIERLERLIAGTSGMIPKIQDNWEGDREKQARKSREEAERNWHRDQVLRSHCSEHDKWEARWGKGPRAGSTGDPFIDDPFFNPWAPGGKFNK